MIHKHFILYVLKHVGQQNLTQYSQADSRIKWFTAINISETVSIFINNL